MEDMKFNYNVKEDKNAKKSMKSILVFLSLSFNDIIFLISTIIFFMGSTSSNLFHFESADVVIYNGIFTTCLKISEYEACSDEYPYLKTGKF
ncbi:hypothetical protein HZS_2319 [Henneguya salminicola]|nr:hypothetical protein HZS_2319 [Henneguya salminicola]